MLRDVAGRQSGRCGAAEHRAEVLRYVHNAVDVAQVRHHCRIGGRVVVATLRLNGMELVGTSEWQKCEKKRKI